MTSSAFLSTRFAATDRFVGTCPNPLLQRTTLLVVTIAAGCVAVLLARRFAVAAIEPQLALLLRGMASIKASIALAAIALAFWRLGRPVSVGVASGYIAGVASLVVAVVLIWSLSFVAIAAIVFHIGLFGLLILAWREDGSTPRNGS